MAIDERDLFAAVELDMSPEFRRRLARDLLAAWSAGAEPTDAPMSAPGLDDPPRHRRAWVTASAAALLIATTIGVTAIRLQREPGVDDNPRPTTVTTTTAVTSTTSTTTPDDTTPAQPDQRGLRGGDLHVGAVLTDIHAINLDPYLDGGPPWSVTDRDGPYLIFDLEQLPEGWHVVSVEGSHPLSVAGYTWKAELSTEGVRATLRVEDLYGFTVNAPSSPVTIRGRDGFESTANRQAELSWREQDTTQVTLSSPSASALPALRALAQSLQAVSVDSIGPQPAWPPADGGISFDVGPPELSGTISGHPFTVDTGDEALGRALYPRVDRVLLASVNTNSVDYPNPYGVTTTAVIGGVMVLAVLPSEIDHAQVQLSDSSYIDVAGYHWTDRTGIVVPIPHGLDVTSIDFQTADGTSLQHIDIPEYPPVVSGAFTTP